MKRLILFFLFVFAVQAGFSQGYNQAIGLRFANGGGISYKKNLGGMNNLEALAGLRFHNNGNANDDVLVLTGLYEWQMAISGIPQLSWYIGLGAHVGVGNDLWLGGDGIIGLEYKIKPAPIAISLDWKPAFNITGDGFWGDEVGLTIRYTF
jgi:hypothetical protein